MTELSILMFLMLSLFWWAGWCWLKVELLRQVTSGDNGGGKRSFCCWELFREGSYYIVADASAHKIGALVVLLCPSLR
jgi:hypothetical protein